MRIGYRLRVKNTRTLDVFGEIFNVTNRVNFDNPTGDRRSGQFLVPTTLTRRRLPAAVPVGDTVRLLRRTSRRDTETQRNTVFSVSRRLCGLSLLCRAYGIGVTISAWISAAVSARL